MSRPIDADALTRIFESCRDTAPVLGLQSIIAVDDALQMVIDAPTIPAISVEWLFGLIDAFVTTGDANMQEYASLLTDIIETWQKEQEER